MLSIFTIHTGLSGEMVYWAPLTFLTLEISMIAIGTGGTGQQMLGYNAKHLRIPLMRIRRHDIQSVPKTGSTLLKHTLITRCR